MPDSSSHAPQHAGLLVDHLLAHPQARPWIEALCSGTVHYLTQTAPSAQAYVAAALAGGMAEGRLWVVCRDLRQQERVVSELETWGLQPIFLPEEETLPIEDAVGDPEILAERLHVLSTLASTNAQRQPLVLSAQSLDEQVPPPAAFRRESLVVKDGQELPMDDFKVRLEKAGYVCQAQVFARGQFAIRGGILDIFPWQAGYPVRLEYFGDTVESLREFDLHTQTSLCRVPQTEILLERAAKSKKSIPLRQWLQKNDFALALGGPVDGIGCTVDDNPLDGIDGDYQATEPGQATPQTLAFHANPVGTFEAGDILISEKKHAEFVAQIRQWKAEGWLLAILFQNTGEKERFTELMAATPDVINALEMFIAPMAFGFLCPSIKLVVLSAAEIFGRYPSHRARRKFNREAAQRRVRHAVDARDLEPGDHVVHADYGIAIFRGLAHRTTQGGEREVLVLEYEDSAKLFVPLDQAHLVSRYVGVGTHAPTLSKLGDARWSKTRQRAEKDILDYAATMLAVQAERQTIRGYAQPPDTRWQWEFENSFPYRETPDQIKAIRQVKQDMESERPMDRLICGDVGFGKTEVAIRAVFKAVMGGTQAAVLVPTTVLAQQHFDTFRQRMSGYPVRVELLCRLQSPAEQDAILLGLKDGSVDVVIGTHRLVSPDIHFARLGLVVIDEEQRFGVKHKERFKDLFRLVDVMTLSATPIPRTLYMSLVGLREMSTIETPPPNRLPVHTLVCPYDERMVRSAMRQELDRGGQVFYLHNRVSTIEHVREKLQSLCPGARILTGHGQMDRHELEDVMHRFVRGDADVLVATTIIESGIDIPNANTIFIDRADLFGLADLYQLRGRVGRSGTKAYAYLMLPRGQTSTGDARKRLNAMKEYAALGSGFKVAMRDLEIRGAGNLLGVKQSGHIANIGFDLYCQLLKQSVAKLGGHVEGTRIDVVLHTDFLVFSESEHAARPAALAAYIPASYIEEPSFRILAYRNLAECATRKELKSLLASWRDRFGPAPVAVQTLADATALKIAAAAIGISSVEIRGEKLMLMRNGEYLLVNGKHPRLPGKAGLARLTAALDLLKSGL